MCEYFYLKHARTGLFIHLLGKCFDGIDGQKLILAQDVEETSGDDERLPLRWTEDGHIEIMDTGFRINIDDIDGVSEQDILGRSLVINANTKGCQINMTTDGILQLLDSTHYCVQFLGGSAVEGTVLIVGDLRKSSFKGIDGNGGLDVDEQYSFELIPAMDLL
jgi:hypothetical protein